MQEEEEEVEEQGGGGEGRRWRSLEGRFAGFYGISTSPPHPQEMHGLQRFWDLNGADMKGPCGIL